MIFALLILSAQVLDVGVLTATNGIEIAHCHAGDPARIHVVPVHPETNRVGGWWTTTNCVIRLRDLSMIPNGTNVMEIRTLCNLSTSQPVFVRFIILRTPKPPRVALWTMPEDWNPPSPWSQPLPGGVNDSYAQFMERVESGKRRSE